MVSAKTALRWAGNGLVAGIVFVVTEMLYSLIVEGTPFAPLAMIASIPLQQLPDQIPLSTSVPVGIAFHLLLSAVFGSIITAAISSLEPLGASGVRTMVAASIGGLILWPVNFYLLAPIVHVPWFATTTSPLWQGFVAHTFFFGGTLGLLLVNQAEGRVRVRLETLYEAMSCGVLVHDRWGNIVHVNDRARDILAASTDGAGRIQSQSFWRLQGQDGSEIAPEDHPSTQVAGTGQAIRGATFAIARPDGTPRWVQLDSVPVWAPDGTIDQIVSSFIDVTGRVEAEAALRRLNDELEQRVQARTAELAASNRNLEAFSYSVSHDLRAPLRGIDGFAQALFEDYGDKLDEVGRGYLERVRGASQRMGRLIEAILGMSKVARADVRRDRIDLTGVAQTLVAELQAAETERTVKVVIDEGVTAHADPDLARLILQNLLGNAWKFTSQLPAPTISFGTLTESGDTVYYVRDDGPGFDPEYADKLFLPFQRLHDAEEFPGDGVGLANVQRAVERHGGRVWAEAQVGQGATFYFTLDGKAGTTVIGSGSQAEATAEAADVSERAEFASGPSR